MNNNDGGNVKRRRRARLGREKNSFDKVTARAKTTPVRRKNCYFQIWRTPSGDDVRDRSQTTILKCLSRDLQIQFIRALACSVKL